MSTELKKLTEDFPLNAGWSLTETFTDKVEIGGLVIHLCGLVAGATDGRTATASSASCEGLEPYRAYFELIERIQVLELSGAVCYHVRDFHYRDIGYYKNDFEKMPSHVRGAWIYSKSNGVAVGPTWSIAAQAAEMELIERDALLNSWFGKIEPVRIDPPSESVALSGMFEFESHLLTAVTRQGAPAHVVVTCGYPTESSAPFLIGFGCKPEIPSALAKSWQECLQRLGFLWGEDLPRERPDVASSAMFHQELFLLPEFIQRVRHWLAGRHAERFSEAAAREIVSLISSKQEGFVDLTPPELLGKLWVAKAISPTLLPLYFGTPELKSLDCYGAETVWHPFS